MTFKDNAGGWRNRVYEVVRLSFYRRKVAILASEGIGVTEHPIEDWELVFTIAVRCKSREEIPGFARTVMRSNMGNAAYQWAFRPEYCGYEERHTLEDLDRPNGHHAT